jgi:membrane protease YdiL (CAAX protease family)
MTTTRTGPEFRDAWRAVLAYALLAGVLLVVVGVPLVTAWQGAPIHTESLGTLDLFAAHALLAVFLGIWFALQQRDGPRTFLALPRGEWPRRLGAGIRLGLAGWLLTLGTMATLALLTGSEEREPAPEFVEFVTWLVAQPLGLRVLLVVSAMTIEEAFFRAFLQPRAGIAVATGCFALGHVGYGSPMMGLGVLVIGLVLALAFRRRGDVAVCVVAHGVFDAVQLLVVLPLVAARL